MSGLHMTVELSAEAVEAIARRAAEFVLEELESRTHNASALTVADVAQLRKVSEKTVRRAIGRGDLRASREGGRWRVDGTDLDDWVDASRPGKAATAVGRRPRGVTSRAGLLTVLTASDPKEEQ